jgi:hypothetical protein
MPSDIREAQRMIDLFTSVGATRFNVTFLDILGRKTITIPSARCPPCVIAFVMDEACRQLQALHRRTANTSWPGKTSSSAPFAPFSKLGSVAARQRGHDARSHASSCRS